MVNGTNVSLTDTEFIERFFNAKKSGCRNKTEMMKYMGISRTQFYRKMKSPIVKNDLEHARNKKEQVVHKEVQEEINHSEQIIRIAYQLHEKGIKDATNAGDWEEARRLSIDALRICKTEAEIKKVFVMIGGDVNIHEETTVNIQLNQHIQRVYGKLCDRCRKAVREE